MSFLNKLRQENLKQFEKRTKLLKDKGLDLQNLPKVENKKHTFLPKPQNIKQQKVEKPEQDSDEEDFNMLAYIKAKKDRGGASRIQTQTDEEGENYEFKKSDFSFDEFQYSKNDKNKGFQKIQQMNFAPKPSKKPIKQGQPWRIIERQSNNEKVKMDKALKSFQSSRINYIIADNKQWQNFKKSQDSNLMRILKNFPKIKNFKNNQKAIIKCGLQQHDIFVCMPTGGGKSLTFQVLTFIIKGVYLCVLPLISLIFDQQSQAKMLGIEAYSLTAKSDVRQIYNRLNNFERNQNSIVIFCTPQKLNLSPAFSQILQTIYQQGQLKRVVIDQVHCVSTWGKQFRIQYENLSSIKKKFPKTPILALTATVTQTVKQDIIAKLGITNCYFFQSSFNRPNLYYQVRSKDKNVLPQIQEIIRRFKNKSGLIYCLSRKSCQQLSAQLNEKGHNTAFYHADIPQQSKKQVQQSWMRNRINIIIATVAFGMGINKPDVRFVIHHTLSKSLQNYYQQSGRAGRDGQYSQCILFYKKADKQLLMNMTLKNDFSTKESKQFSTKQLAQMIKYCEDKLTCRRQFQLGYLGQTDFDPKLCDNTCDNCKKGRNIVDFQVIDQAKLILSTLLNLQSAKISISKNQFISILKNKAQKNKTLKYKLPAISRAGIDLQELQNSFGQWKLDDIEMLMLDFMSNDILTERIVDSQVTRKGTENNFSNVYLKCHVPKCRVFIEKVQTLAFKREVSQRQYGNNEEVEEQASLTPQELISDGDQGDQQSIDFTNITRRQPIYKTNSLAQGKYSHIIQSMFQDDD